MKFGYEDLQVWQKAVEYAVEVLRLVDSIDLPRKHYRLFEQLESSAASVASNIAEGKGRNSKKEFVQMLYIARGSLYESMTQLEMIHRMGWISDDKIEGLGSRAKEVVRMIVGLIKSIKDSV